jgi:hypothetical protein
MLDNDIYNINQEFDYSMIKAIVLKCLEKMVKQEALKNRPNIPDDVIFDYERVDDNSNNVELVSPPTPLLKLKVRNTTQYLNWRIAVLKRDDFRCQICHTSMKDNKIKTRGTSCQSIQRYLHRKQCNYGRTSVGM